MEIKLNLNDQVEVKLTKHGKNVLKKHPSYYTHINEEGFYEFSLWNFANIFGKEFYNGQMNPSIVDNEIIIKIK